MNRPILCLLLLATMLCSTLSVFAQQQTTTSVIVPRLIRFGGVLKDADGMPLQGKAGITFALYKNQEGGSALWLETQNVSLDTSGHYSVLLGATKEEGVPMDLFTSGAAQWLGIQAQGQPEQPRVLLVSVPYALKAADAETVGGLPPSAFVRAAVPAAGVEAPSDTSASSSAPALPSVTGSGTLNFLPIWTGTSTIGNSALFQSGSGSSAKIGINTKTPAATLDVHGGETLRGLLYLPPTGTATATQGFKSNAQQMTASVYNKTSGAAVPVNFRWQVEPVGNNTANTSATLNLLYGAGGNPISETGVHIASNGQITFPGGTVTGNETVMGSTLSMTVGDVGCGNGEHGLGSAGIDTSRSLNCSGYSLLGDGKTTFLNRPTGGYIKFREGNGDEMVIQPGGNVGIGTTTPGSKLEVAGGNISSAGNGVNVLLGNVGCVSPTWGIQAGNIPANCGNFALGIDASSTSGTFINRPRGGGIHFKEANDPNGDQMVIAPGGNVGIGTNSPSRTLEVFGSSTVRYAITARGFSTTGGSAIEGVGGNAPDLLNPASGGAGVDGYGGNGVGGGGAGVEGIGGSGPNEDGVGGLFDGGFSVGSNFGDGINVATGSGLAGSFGGDLAVTGAIQAGTKDFKIDHPLDPANKYLIHASVESSEMKTIYDGVVTTNAHGEATVQLPEWFEVLNTNFRYQLTVMGQFAQAIIARKIQNHQFMIRTSAPNVEVFWQITGVRQDAFAKAHPLVVEQEKEPRLRGFYIHPELYGAPEEKQIEWARHPQLMRRAKEIRVKQLAAAQHAQRQAATASMDPAR